MIKPILFNTAMVRAILDGKKTMTRRIVKTPAKPPCRKCDQGGTTMNEKEALQNIRNLTKHLDNSDDRLVGTFRLVIIALNKQIPKKPDYEGDGYDGKGNMIYDTWICPNCGEKYEVDYDDYKYCPNCGQRLDWEENHEQPESIG